MREKWRLRIGTTGIVAFAVAISIVAGFFLIVQVRDLARGADERVSLTAKEIHVPIDGEGTTGITNEGLKEIVISGAHPSCSCILLRNEYPIRVRPHETAELRFAIKPQEVGGLVSLYIPELSSPIVLNVTRDGGE